MLLVDAPLLSAHFHLMGEGPELKVEVTVRTLGPVVSLAVRLWDEPPSTDLLDAAAVRRFREALAGLAVDDLLRECAAGAEPGEDGMVVRATAGDTTVEAWGPNPDALPQFLRFQKALVACAQRARVSAEAKEALAQIF